MDQLEKMDINIVDAQRRNANLLYPHICLKMQDLGEGAKRVIAISGGSGVGKTGMAWLLKERFAADGISAFILSGDHYPHRIPMYNDAERLRIFRVGGLSGLLKEKMYDAAVQDILKKLQMQEEDAEERWTEQYPWLAVYQKYSDGALEDYLGTEKELLFSEVSSVLSAFKRGEEILWLRRMGRQDYEIWYEEEKTKDKEVLILEWTHGNSPLLTGVDLSIVLKSTPQETLENRKKRNRDAKVTSPFVARVLRIEQKKIDAEIEKADIIQDMAGHIM
ncbi:MAG: adenylylsulfate kinase [Lachnospiraceae bacterium]|nr:adenylylsulfate kinase [Lachnospiraceae bacterium]